MEQKTITFEQMPHYIGLLLERMEGLEAKLGANIAPPPPQPDYVTLTEALSLLRGTVKRQTLYNWHSQGRISANKVGRKLLFKRSDVEAILNNGLEKIEQ